MNQNYLKWKIRFKQLLHLTGIKKIKPRIIAVKGGSGSGKSYIVNKLKKFGFVETVSDTTRKIRKGEVDGVNYNFKTTNTFKFDDMAEYAPYSGNYYGTSKKELESKLKRYGIVFIVIEEQGIKQLKKIYGDALEVVYVYVDEETMAERMSLRGDSKEDIQKRLNYAKRTGELNGYKSANLVIEGIWDKSSDILIDFILNSNNNEIERKFILDRVLFEKEYGSVHSLPKSKMLQAYEACYDKDVRFRSTDDVMFEKTIKHSTNDDNVRLEENLPIDKDVFVKNYKNLSYKVSKYRHYALYSFRGTHRVYKAEIDIIDNFDDIIIEFEFMSKEDALSFVVPSWCVEEVTSNAYYKNKSIAEMLSVS